MITYPKNYRIAPVFDNEEWLVKQADQVLLEPIPHLTDTISDRSPGTSHDYFSEGDYWWPNPDTADHLPYVKRDGETNPDNFNGHRMILRRMKTYLADVACAYQLTGNERYAKHGVKILKEFFLDEETRMNPHLSYAQAIAGHCTGRGIGIIDTIHLADVVFAADKLYRAGYMTEGVCQELKKWFAAYLGWMLTSPIGIEEMNTLNNHCVCFFMQAAAFALFTDNELIADFCREQYKKRLLPQMAWDGSFPLELARTKPYNYSAFIVDNLVTICHVLSKQDNDLWEYRSPDGHSIHKALDFITPFILDKSLWPYPPDVMYDDSFPIRYSFLMFAGCTLGNEDLIKFFQSLPYEPDPQEEEAHRNLAVVQPRLWM